jgi:hypothetical protein
MAVVVAPEKALTGTAKDSKAPPGPDTWAPGVGQDAVSRTAGR